MFSLGTVRSLASATTFQATLGAALDQDINDVETARGYSQSEKLLGRSCPSLFYPLVGQENFRDTQRCEILD